MVTETSNVAFVDDTHGYIRMGRGRLARKERKGINFQRRRFVVCGQGGGRIHFGIRIHMEELDVHTQPLFHQRIAIYLTCSLLSLLLLS